MKFKFNSFTKKVLKKVAVLVESKRKEFNSKEYWEKRYRMDGNSGPGSYGRLSIFKANVINDFIENNKIKTIIELGCGDGNQLQLANYDKYIGFDVSNEALKICKNKFKNDNSKVFLHYNDLKRNVFKSELSISLDVVFHLIEDDVFHDYMVNLFNVSSNFVIIYSSNYDGVVAQHVKCRKFTEWIELNLKKQFNQVSFIKNAFPFDSINPNETSMSDFYIFKRIN